MKHSEKEFIALIENHQPLIHKVCRMYCSDEEERQDLFQDILLQLWKAFPKFRAEAKLSTWMYRIALNVAISSLRKQSKQPERTELDSQLEHWSDHRTPHSESVESEQSVLFYQAVEKLTKVEKAFLMLYLEEKTYEEMAEVLSVTVNHCRVKLHRIKEKLKTLLKHH